MNFSKRVQKIETSLTPTEGALLFLKDMLKSTPDGYADKLFADPSNPRIAIVKSVGEAVRENLTTPRLEPEQLEQAVREAQKQTDMLIVLVLQLHEEVRSACNHTRASLELLGDKIKRMRFEMMYKQAFEPNSWESWRDNLEGTLLSMWILKETITSISAQHYDGHPLLFATEQEKFNEQIACLEDMVKINNSVRDILPPINRDPQSTCFREQVETGVELLLRIAKARTLAAFGENEAARELLDSSRVRALQRKKQLLAFGSGQGSTS